MLTTTPSRMERLARATVLIALLEALRPGEPDPRLPAIPLAVPAHARPLPPGSPGSILPVAVLIAQELCGIPTGYRFYHQSRAISEDLEMDLAGMRVDDLIQLVRGDHQMAYLAGHNAWQLYLRYSRTMERTVPIAAWLAATLTLPTRGGCRLLGLAVLAYVSARPEPADPVATFDLYAGHLCAFDAWLATLETVTPLAVTAPRWA